METVAVLGASTNPERYSYKAVAALLNRGHRPIPIAKHAEEIQGLKAYSSISEVTLPIDTVTIYVRPEVLRSVIDEIIEKAPSRVIMNPGTEDAELKKRFEDEGISVVEACSLVLLSTDQF